MIVKEQMNVVVTGANGQLAAAFKTIAIEYPAYHFIFLSKEECDITDRKSVESFFAQNALHACINCAAYTAVDLAETQRESAMQVNALAPGYLAAACVRHGVRFFHFSTDYVFDGTATKAYTENDPVNPLNVYGESKLAGEQAVLNTDPEAIVIRTSWVYSNDGKNFLKTMIRLMGEKENINVVHDQFGSPTYTLDLAKAVMAILSGESKGKGGLYHYCNAGIISWFEFATAIQELAGSTCKVNAIPAKDFPVAAKRPGYSALDTAKIQKTFGLTIPSWKDSLQKCLEANGRVIFE